MCRQYSLGVKVSDYEGAKNAARCIALRSTLNRPTQHAESADTARGVLRHLWQ